MSGKYEDALGQIANLEKELSLKDAELAEVKKERTKDLARADSLARVRAPTS